MPALDGLKVLDFSRFLSGPYCTKVLADMGADVVKVERVPAGDDSRRMAPKVNGQSYPFALANANKRSIAVDLKTEAGRDIALRLASEADILVENFRPGVMHRLGIDFDTVAERNPRLIYCSISAFGQTGPHAHRAGFDIMAQGFAGIMGMTGSPGDERPAKAGIAIADIAAGATAVHAILYATLRRLQTGKGQYIDIALVDACLAWTMWEEIGRAHV